MKTLDEMMAELDAETRGRVETKAKRLIRAESLRQLRKAMQKTQADIADATGMSQHNISRLEGREDMYVSTLGEYVKGLGGTLRLVADMPGGESIDLELNGRAPKRRIKAANI